MKEQEHLYQKAFKFYAAGKELDAIENYKVLLSKYPENIKGWVDLATMQYEIYDYNESLRSSEAVIRLEPNNPLHLNNYITRLSLLKKFTFKTPNWYLDESTKEAFHIEELTGTNSLHDKIENATLKYIDLNKNNLSAVHSAYRRIGNNAIKYGYFEKGIKYLKIALALKDNRKSRTDPSPSILLQISNGYLNLKEYTHAHSYIDEAFENGLDDFSLLKKADIYKAQELENNYTSTIDEFLKRIDNKIQTQPESAYINQKIKALLKLKDYNRAQETLKEFDLLKPLSPYEQENLDKQKTLIEAEKKR